MTIAIPVHEPGKSDSVTEIKKRYFCVKTFGCQMNYADSEKIHRVLMQSGCLKALDPVQADIVILNTCSVRQKGEDKVFGFIREIRKAAKASGKSVLIGVTGCMARKTGMAKRYLGEETSRKESRKITLIGQTGNLTNWDDPLLLRSEDIDFVFRIEETSHLSKILSIIYGENFGNDEKWEEYLKIGQTSDSARQANVIIQTGCDNFCSFCIVPYTRGRELSRPMEDIVAEVTQRAAEGVIEVTLLGQNVNSYGKFTKKKLWDSESLKWTSLSDRENVTPFRELLNRISQIRWIDRIRFTSSNPHDMTQDILDAHFELPNLCNYLHIALQSGSDTVLKRMNRKHTYADFKAQIEYLRSHDPLFSISTDIIVGFPGETEEEFQMTVKAMRECEFDFAFIARYSPRNGTRSAELPDDVTPETKALRWSILTDVLEEQIQKRAELMIGLCELVSITGKWRHGNWTGRTRNHKEVFVESSDDLLGKTVPVKITRLDDWTLVGELA